MASRPDPRVQDIYDTCQELDGLLSRLRRQGEAVLGTMEYVSPYAPTDGSTQNLAAPVNGTIIQQTGNENVVPQFPYNFDDGSTQNLAAPVNSIITQRTGNENMFPHFPYDFDDGSLQNLAAPVNSTITRHTGNENVVPQFPGIDNTLPPFFSRGDMREEMMWNLNYPAAMTSSGFNDTMYVPAQFSAPPFNSAFAQQANNQEGVAEFPGLADLLWGSVSPADTMLQPTNLGNTTQESTGIEGVMGNNTGFQVLMNGHPPGRDTMLQPMNRGNTTQEPPITLGSPALDSTGIEGSMGNNTGSQVLTNGHPPRRHRRSRAIDLGNTTQESTISFVSPALNSTGIEGSMGNNTGLQALTNGQSPRRHRRSRGAGTPRGAGPRRPYRAGGAQGRQQNAGQRHDQSSTSEVNHSYDTRSRTDLSSTSHPYDTRSRHDNSSINRRDQLRRRVEGSDSPSSRGRGNQHSPSRPARRGQRTDNVPQGPS